MNRDDIIRMAREAFKVEFIVESDKQRLEKFVALVAAAVEERLKWDGLHSCHSECDRPACVHTRKAVEAEREACAKVCEELEYDGYEMLPRAPRMARLIRARGSNESNS